VAPPCDSTTAAATIMYPFYGPAQTELTSDDVAGICSLYPTCEKEGCEAGFTCSAGACLPECGEGVCQLDELCFNGACLSQGECEQVGCLVSNPPWISGCEPTDTCPRGLCLEDGSCARQCARDADCVKGRSCVFDQNPNTPGYCGSIPLKKLGEKCSSALECEDGECLAGAESHAVCTRTCSSVDPSCPIGWSCASVDGQATCVPPRAPRGCAVSAGVESSPPSPHWGPLWLVLCAASCRRWLLRFPGRRRSASS
jgi:hypothetical protein